MITHKELIRRLTYHPDTGLFTWNIETNSRSRVGSVAGSNIRGYVQIEINRKGYRAHRLAWFWMTGTWPIEEIDHVNEIKNDNRWENLRQATRSQNECNRKRSDRNKSGYKGVSSYRNGQSWQVSIVVNGNRFLRYYKTKAEAIQACEEQRALMHGQFCNHG